MKAVAPPVQALIATGLFFLVFWLFVPLRFQSNDDIVMMMLASGAYSGEPSAHLVFANYVLGLVLSSLHTVLPGVDWYPGLMLLSLSACGALGLVAIGLRLRNGEPFFIFAWTALGCLLLSMMVQMQFTTTAAMVAAVGSWSMLTLPGRLLKALGAALVLYGFLLRFEAAALVFVVGAPFFLLGLRTGVTTWRRSLGLGLVILVASGLHLAGERTYHAMDPAYDTFNTIRGQLNDNRNADLPPDALPEGVSADDYALLLNFFADPAQLGPDDLAALRAAVSEREQRLTPDYFVDAALAVLESREVLLLLAAMVMAAVLLPGRAQRLLLLAGCLTFLLPLYYTSVFALFKSRVLLGACAAVLAGLFYPGLHARNRWPGLIVQVPLIGLTGLFLMSAMNRVVYTVDVQPAFRTQAEMVEGWDGPVYAFKNHLKTESARLFTDDLAAFSGKVVFAGWMVRHPGNRSYLSHEDLLEDDAAVFMAQKAESDAMKALIIDALRDNYGIEAEAFTVAETDQGQLVTFRRAPDP